MVFVFAAKSKALTRQLRFNSNIYYLQLREAKDTLYILLCVKLFSLSCLLKIVIKKSV